MSAHIVVVFSVIFATAEPSVYGILALMAFLTYKVSIPYMSADNQLHKVGHGLWHPIHSYFHEQMRGVSVIRAFNQEEKVMSRQSEMLDHTTTHFIAHHSCWVWYCDRMFLITNLITLVTIITCIQKKGEISNVTLCLLINWTFNMDWLIHLFGCINWFQR